MLVKDKKYAVAVSDMQGWRISEFRNYVCEGSGVLRSGRAAKRDVARGVHSIGKRIEKEEVPEAVHPATNR
jgi:hypothetical protein